MTDRYDGILLPYHDAKVASALCPGVPMKYTIRDENVITDAWLDMYVSQNMLKNEQLDVLKFLHNVDLTLLE